MGQLKCYAVEQIRTIATSSRESGYIGLLRY
jgi:hypothetical protein